MSERRQERRRGPVELDTLLRARVRDVFDYPKQGIVFKDITPLLADHVAFAGAVDAIVNHWGRGTVDKVVGIEARGFIIAAPVAYHFGAGFVPVRKKGKLPSATIETSYELEYGEATLEVHQDAFGWNDRVLIVDDVLATGGTVEATVDLVRRAGGDVSGVAVLLELGFLNGRQRLERQELPLFSLLTAWQQHIYAETATILSKLGLGQAVAQSAITVPILSKPAWERSQPAITVPIWSKLGLGALPTAS